ncbi:hypothetical protein [Actinoallomurus iriomotensis]|uniref:Secreted protein n=1 Tax=Actinoallomurus iriomotensis TaxID=478107 RepID=A0A9W6S8J8_9ACTN|nr:hypothetical protein [Actinoallomurus iriomotensis]GLY90330.1 hypothetical protein Airi02_082590 [Actinoallomurus iriomotensis]
MGLKTMVLAGTTLATMTIGFAAPALAAAAPAAQPGRTIAALQTGGDDGNDSGVSGLSGDSPVCSALDAETVPTGDVVGRCLAGTTLL